ncbi:MAG: tRNA guanosine(34) transglycosylase Tgt [Treponema sp.]|jgi:queuine tRNA-ribosyltransferase|nr:tRNA guanosine(34) transglycosylase Tgt [Treponema sp.]
MGCFVINHAEPAGHARTGILELPHGKVSTPVFMPVGTNGTVKALTVDDLETIGFEIILSNTYHLYLRPGTGVIGAAGGLHKFMNWKKNILTDSGGFQIFSLAPLRKICPEGAEFQSHIDGARHFFSPETAVEIQAVLGSDIQMALDICTGWGTAHTDALKALEITADWLNRAKQTWEHTRDTTDYRGLLFGIVQGNFYPELRKQSAELTVAADTPGIAIGGLSVGEPPDVFSEYLNLNAALLPPEKPRYVMGIGTPDYILSAIEAGVDMFDCVLPTREARNGRVFTRRGPFALKKAENRLDFQPIDEECGCKVCRAYSRAYLRHLFKTQEILCSMLASYHNLYFLHDLVKNARRAIEEDRFIAFKKNFLSRYREVPE